MSQQVGVHPSPLTPHPSPGIRPAYVVADRAGSLHTGPNGRCGYVFSDDDGTTAWKPNRATKSFLRALDVPGFAGFVCMTLRHFIATELLQAGVALSGCVAAT